MPNFETFDHMEATGEDARTIKTPSVAQLVPMTTRIPGDKEKADLRVRFSKMKNEVQDRGVEALMQELQTIPCLQDTAGALEVAVKTPEHFRALLDLVLKYWDDHDPSKMPAGPEAGPNSSQLSSTKVTHIPASQEEQDGWDAIRDYNPFGR